MTPMMEQYFEIKNKYKYYLIFFRLGDFYELFFEDALIASEALEITLTGRDCGMSERAPMCGVPYHSADGYIARLIEKGHKVAICEQVEDPKKTKTIVKREVVRVVTPGTVTDSNMLDEGKNNYIMCIFSGKDGYGLSFCDVTTGEFIALNFSKDEYGKIIDEMAKYNPSEIICNEGFSESVKIEAVFDKKLYHHSTWAFEYNTAHKKLLGHFKLLNLNSFGITNVYAICAAGALMEYLSETQKNSLSHINKIISYADNDHLMMDISSRRNLELTETVRDRSKKGTLLWLLDKTKTAMGARLLRKYIEQPLMKVSSINQRLDAVGELKDAVIQRDELRQNLKAVFDIERIISRIIYQSANARDLVALKCSLKSLPAVRHLLSDFNAELLRKIYNSFDLLEDIAELIETSIADEPPFSVREGGLIRDGYNEALDKYRSAKNNGQSWLDKLEIQEREATGIKSLKIKFNKVFGYYIEITNSYKDMAPERYVRRQTMSNAERFTTAELKEIEAAILGAEEKITELEYDIFVEIRNKIGTEATRIQKTASVIARIDVLQSLAEASNSYGYVKPIVDNNSIIDIKDGRHPVVEQLRQDKFVPNDTFLDNDDDRLLIITGPNMAGKSTYMRQVALIVLMAQIGCFVPADSARIGVVDRIFTRVGASDDLATGQSTFMVEMTEMANILNNATKNSLLILDEIGRGTSTFDGLSIAWAVLEYIASTKKLGARTLFATHYHELTELEGKISGVKNYYVMVEEQGDNIIFLRKIARGGTEDSYGIQVAKLAGLPNDIIKRSNVILRTLNSADVVKHRSRRKQDMETIVWQQQYLDDSDDADVDKDNHVYNEIVEILNGIDIDSLSAREALQILYDFKGKL